MTWFLLALISVSALVAATVNPGAINATVAGVIMLVIWTGVCVTERWIR